ncbi:MAG: uL15m family ribosomal protein, partial [Alphaproteobacteria bacterium]|nr:uL15m family ribosomal protein [Alphaproteobacteria bacterium]
GAVIDGPALVAAGVIRREKDGIRLLGKGELSAKVNLKVAGASKSAIEQVEKAGGSVEVTTPAKAEAAPVESAD